MRRPILFKATLALGIAAGLASCSDDRPEADCGPSYTMDNKGECRLLCTADSQCLATEACSSGTCGPRPDKGPEITVFNVAPTALALNESATVEFVTVHAEGVSVVLVGPGGDRAIAIDGTSGVVRAGPVLGNGVVRISAWRGAMSVMDERTITVGTPPPMVSIASFGANPGRIVAGNSTNLSWEISNGTNRIELVDGNNVTLATEADEQPFAVTPNVTTSYTLRAFGPDNRMAQAMTTVTVDPVQLNAEIKVFELHHATPFHVGDNVAMYWQTMGAQRLRITTRGGDVLVDTTDVERMTEGVWVDLPRGSPIEYHLSVESGQSEDERTLSVVPAPVIPPPVFTGPVVATPRFREANDTTVGVNWTLPQGTIVRVLANGTQVFSGTGSGPYNGAAAAGSTVHFVVEAENSAGFVRARASSWETRNELEPNDLQLIANTIPLNMAMEGTADQFSTDDDWYVVEAAVGDTLDIALLGACLQNGTTNEIEIMAASTTNVINSSMVTGCPSLRVPIMAAGSYNIHLSLGASSNRGYQLIVDRIPAFCGDGTQQQNEECDDNNLLHNDACTPACVRDPDYDIRTTPPVTTPAGPVPTAVPIYAVAGGLPRDRGVAAVLLPFEVPHYGSRHRGVLVSVDGFVGFDPTAFAGNLAPLTGDPPNNVIALFAADLMLRDPGDSLGQGRIGYITGNTPNGRSVVVSIENAYVKGRPTTQLGGGVLFSDDGKTRVGYTPLSTGADPNLQVQAGIQDASGAFVVPAPGCGGSATCPISALPSNYMFEYAKHE